jgi:hypothetical protein
MEAVGPWSALIALIEQHYPKASKKGGLSPYPLATMLRIHLLQYWYSLSDPAMEEALIEVPTMRRRSDCGYPSRISRAKTNPTAQKCFDRPPGAQKPSRAVLKAFSSRPLQSQGLREDSVQNVRNLGRLQECRQSPSCRALASRASWASRRSVFVGSFRLLHRV